MQALKILIVSLCVCHVTLAQSIATLKAINTEIWQPFTKAFETYDYNLFKSIHSPELIRISGDGKHIRTFEDYINRYKTRWASPNPDSQTISFRFTERIHNNNTASERGIYKLTIHKDTNNTQSYYGQFHVLLQNRSGKWLILMDYDSSENQTIGEIHYNNAFAIHDFSKYAP